MTKKRTNSDGDGVVHQRILGTLREAIRRGKWQPGERLPTVRELCTTHGASLLTVHRALRALTELGFISTHGRLGTVVTDHPPHRCRFGLVLPELPGPDGHYGHLRWEALAQAARTFTAPERRIEIFHGIGPHPELAPHHAVREAVADLRLAGLVVPHAGMISAWFSPESCPLPVIGDDCQSPSRVARTGAIHLHQHEFFAAALDAVKARRMTRIAVLVHHDAIGYGTIDHLRTATAARGLEFADHSILGVDPQRPAWAGHAALSLCRSPRPHALIIADDHLVPGATAAVRGLGKAAPLVIVQANLPVQVPCHVPCLRLGWDHRDYLALAIDRLSRHLATGEPVGVHRLPLRPIEEIS